MSSSLTEWGKTLEYYNVSVGSLWSGKYFWYTRSMSTQVTEDLQVFYSGFVKNIWVHNYQATNDLSL